MLYLPALLGDVINIAGAHLLGAGAGSIAKFTFCPNGGTRETTVLRLPVGVPPDTTHLVMRADAALPLCAPPRPPKPFLLSHRKPSGTIGNTSFYRKYAKQKKKKQ